MNEFHIRPLHPHKLLPPGNPPERPKARQPRERRVELFPREPLEHASKARHAALPQPERAVVFGLEHDVAHSRGRGEDQRDAGLERLVGARRLAPRQVALLAVDDRREREAQRLERGAVAQRVGAPCGRRKTSWWRGPCESVMAGSAGGQNGRTARVTGERVAAPVGPHEVDPELVEGPAAEREEHVERA